MFLLMKKENKNAPRQMWSSSEDNLLRKILGTGAKMTWNQIAKRLQEEDPKVTKTGKQCRERYRNYLNPNITERPWTKSEKTVFILLHNHYQNHWGEIAKFYKGRSDISIKNLFYAHMRKVLKKIKNGSTSINITSKPKKLLKIYYILSLINEKYLPTLDRMNGKLPDAKNEKIMLELIKAKKVTKDEIMKYMEELIACCENSTAKESFPIIIEISLKELRLNSFTEKTMKDILLSQKFGKLSRFVKLQAIFPPEGPSLATFDLPQNPSLLTAPAEFNKRLCPFGVNKSTLVHGGIGTVPGQTLVPTLPSNCGFVYSYNPYSSYQPIIQGSSASQLVNSSCYQPIQSLSNEYMQLIINGNFFVHLPEDKKRKLGNNEDPSMINKRGGMNK